MPDVPVPQQLSREEWLARFADRLGVRPPTADEIEDLLALAGVAAHASERTAAPISCWLVATAGVDPADARQTAAELAKELATVARVADEPSADGASG